MIFTLVYVSFAHANWSSTELEELLRACRERNQALGVTGMLLYKDRSFIQLLEGEEGAVRALYDDIARDPQHEEITTVWTGFDRDRRFPGWSMGFTDLARPPAELDGYTDFLRAPLAERSTDHLGLDLLDLFRRVR